MFMETLLKGIALLVTITLTITTFVVLYAIVNPDKPVRTKPRPVATVSWNV